MTFSVAFVLDGEFVLGAAAGVLAGLDDQRTVLREQAFAAADRVLDERGRGQIPEDLGAGRDALRSRPLSGTRSVTEELPFKCQSGGGRVGLPPHTYHSAYNAEKVARSKRITRRKASRRR